jgi:hypothetical protein
MGWLWLNHGGNTAVLPCMIGYSGDGPSSGENSETKLGIPVGVINILTTGSTRVTRQTNRQRG